jgi:hypothetical protein
LDLIYHPANKEPHAKTSAPGPLAHGNSRDHGFVVNRLSYDDTAFGHYNRAALSVKAKSKKVHQGKSFVLCEATLVKAFSVAKES